MTFRKFRHIQRWCRRFTSYGVVLFCFGLSVISPLEGTPKQIADTIYESALEQVGSVSAEASIEAFHDVLKADRDFAPAHYEIAKLYMSLDTPMDRQSARNALDEAIRLEPRSGDYQMALGELLGKQGLWLSAERHYEKIYENFPEQRAQAAYLVGFFPCRLS